MPTCTKCGAYYSEGSCPFCTPDDSEDSPVTTVQSEESRSVRIIDPIYMSMFIQFLFFITSKIVIV